MGGLRCSASTVVAGTIGTHPHIADVFVEPQVVHREMQVSLPHAQGGTAPGIANPIKFSATPVEYRAAPPLLGQHTESVLSEVLGYSSDDLAALRSENVIG